MKDFRRLLVVVPAVVLLGLLVWLYVTRGAMEELAFLRKGAAQTGLVDQRSYETAQTLAGLAVSAEEQSYAQNAERLADHEVDQAFALELREATLETHVLTGAAAKDAQRVDELREQIKDDQAAVSALTAKNAGVAGSDGDDLDVAKAQLGLDQDELTDAEGDLTRESGDKRAEIQQELQAREARMKKNDEGKKETAVVAASRYATLWGRASAWFEQRNRAKLIAQAQADAGAEAAQLEKQHAVLEVKLGQSAVGQVLAGQVVGSQVPDARPGAPGVGTGGSARVAALKKMAGRRVMMAILDDRAATDRQLAEVYGRWEAQVWVQHRIVGHLVLESLTWLVFVVLLVAVLAAVGRMALARVATDGRRRRTLETILILVLEGLGVVAVLLVVFGVPQQMPTILGFATAGLTVAFADFFVAFVGWFVLMGKNGLRVGDWVEINGVGGEVAEIGLFRTTLLETGNWTSRGHPTGRRVTFTNSFAIRGTYFNFSTHGQWMWDEIKLNVPATANAYDLIQKMQAAVQDKTAKDTDEAEREWQSATSQNGLRQFTARPTVDLRPAASGVDVIVRFVTRAADRFDMRNCLYEAMLGLMEGTERPAVEAEAGGSAGAVRGA